MNKNKCGEFLANGFDELPDDYVGELDDPVEAEDVFKMDIVDIEFASVVKNTDHENIAAILDECKELLLRKGKDYNSGRVKMGDYYPRGLFSIIDIMNAKILRMYSLLESGDEANFESIEDSAKDLINYGGIFIGVSRGLIETPASKDQSGK